MTFRHGKRDATEPEIVKGLRDSGYLVLHLDKFDLLVCGPDGSLYMLECKSPGGEVKPSQKKLTADGWPLHLVYSVEEALSIVGSRDTPDTLRATGRI